MTASSATVVSEHHRAIHVKATGTIPHDRIRIRHARFMGVSMPFPVTNMEFGFSKPACIGLARETS